MPLTKFRAILRIFAGFREISNVKCAKFPAKIRRNFDENKARISSKFALITFAQYCTLSELKLIIIDEISMVSNNKLLHIHQRLKEIFGTLASKLFADISIICVGDFYQLPPIRERPIFCDYRNQLYNLTHPWYTFKMVELEEIMRQKGDNSFTQLLNRVRVAKHTDKDLLTIQSTSIDLSDKNNYPINDLHVWAENKPAAEYNRQRLKEICKPLHVIKAVDQYPSNVSRDSIEKALSKGRSATGGLDVEIHIKESSRVMLTSNIDISDRLINGQLGNVAMKCLVSPVLFMLSLMMNWQVIH